MGSLPPGFEIRDAAPSDAEALASIHVEGWEATYRGMLPDELIDARDIKLRRRIWRERLEESPEGEFLRVGVLDGEVVAFAEFGPSVPDSTDAATFRSLYMRTWAQRQGIGNELTDDLLRILSERGYRRLEGWVVEGNAASRRWLGGMGFELTGATREPDGQGFREVLLVRELQPES